MYIPPTNLSYVAPLADSHFMPSLTVDTPNQELQNPPNPIADEECSSSNGTGFEEERKDKEPIECTVTNASIGQRRETIKNSKTEGKSTITLEDRIVVHDFRETLHGTGLCILIFPDGSKKMGTMNNGNWEGIITEVLPDGISYSGMQDNDGNWVGKVKIKFPNQLMIVGEMVDRKLTGHVVKTFPDGIKREGKYIDHKFVGIVTQTTPAGIVTKGVQQNGCWVGKVTVTYPDGFTMIGICENGKWVGPVTEKDPDGTTTMGCFENGNWQGRTTQILPNGDIFRGFLKDGEPVGNCTMHGNDGSVFKGTFKNGHREGLGTWISPAGKIYKSIWRKGQDCPEEYEAYLKEEGKQGEATFRNLSEEEAQVAKKARRKTKKKNNAGSSGQNLEEVIVRKLMRESNLQVQEPYPNKTETVILPLHSDPAFIESAENADEVLRARRGMEIQTRIPAHKEGRRVRKFETKSEAKLRAFKNKDGTLRYPPEMSLQEILEDRAFHYFPGVRLLVANARDCSIYADVTETGYELDVIRTRNGKRISGVLEITINKENEEYHKYLTKRKPLDEDIGLIENEFSVPEPEWKSDEESVDNEEEWEQVGDFLYSVAENGVITIEYLNEDYKIEILPKRKELLQPNGC